MFLFQKILLLCIYFMFFPPGKASASAEQPPVKTIYIVANEQNFQEAKELREYFQRAEYTVVNIQPEQATTLQTEYYLIIGAPKNSDAVSTFLKKILAEKQWNDAQKMGTARLITGTAGQSEVMIFATDYSLKELISGTSGQWKEIFEDWYDIPMTISQIIGY